MNIRPLKIARTFANFAILTSRISSHLIFYSFTSSRYTRVCSVSPVNAPAVCGALWRAPTLHAAQLENETRSQDNRFYFEVRTATVCDDQKMELFYNE